MRHPEYHPTFTDDEISAAYELVRRRNAPHAKVVRAQVAILLFEDSELHSTDIARRVRIHAKTVRKWRKRWAQEGFSLDDKPRSGRPRSFSPDG